MLKNHIIYNDYLDFRCKVSKAEGSYIYDENGKRYIDFTSGWNVTNLGWNHPEINEALRKQSEKNTFAPMWAADPAQEEYAAKLTAALPKELNACVRGVTGTEAVEVAVKIARAFTGRKKVIGFADTYHGQLFAAMALGFRPNLARNIAPLVPEIIQLEYPRDGKGLDELLAQLEGLLIKEDVAALVTEPGIVTGWGSVHLLPEGYLKVVRELTARHGTLLVLDEVGTGFSRTGKLFALEHEQVVPDLVALAKGIANGTAAIGATIGKSEIIEPTISIANLTSTFGWMPVACAVAVKTLEIHQRDRVWELSEKNGDYLRNELMRGLNSAPLVKDIRGKGMEIGLEITPSPEKYKKILDLAFEKGLHLVGDTESLIQIMPPLTTSKEVLDEGIEILIESIKSLE